MRIGIDIDGVLFPFTSAVNKAVVDKFGVTDPGEHLHWDWLKEQIGDERFAWVWTAEGQAATFGQVQRVYADVVEAFNSFLRDPAHKCHFVTHRDPRRTSGYTAAFLGRHFGGHPWAGLHVIQNGTPKHGLMDWDVFIDDKSSTVAEMLLHTDARVFAPARPWNEELEENQNGRFTRYASPWEVARWVGAQ